MIILYNPRNGSPIPPFKFDGQEYLDENNKETVLAVGETVQFPDEVAYWMKKNWEFLEEVTPQKAKELKEDKGLKCEFCGNNFGLEKALQTHIEETHKKVEENEENLKENLIPDIPVAKTIPVEPNKSLSDRAQDDLTKDDSFYGPGLIEERKVGF